MCNGKFCKKLSKTEPILLSLLFVHACIGSQVNRSGDELMAIAYIAPMHIVATGGQVLHCKNWVVSCVASEHHWKY